MKTKPIYFLIDPRFGSSYLRGEQICNALKAKGYNCKLATRIDPNTKRSIIFIIKNMMGTRSWLTPKFHKSNFVIWDVVDYVYDGDTHGLFLEKYDYADLLIFHNKTFPLFLEEEYNVKKDYAVIPHHWDKRLKIFDVPKDKFRFGYIGDFNSSIFLELVDRKYNTGSPNINCRTSNFLAHFELYNCHFDIKDPDCLKFKSCSSMKLSTAAALDCGIILNKTWSNIELLPEDSIFYCDEISEKGIKNKIKEIKSIYGTTEWDLAMKPIQKIKKRTHIDNIIKLYENIINEY